jgi:predicted dehydrogenase
VESPLNTDRNLEREIMTTIPIHTLMPEITNYNEYTDQDLSLAIIGFGKMGILHSGILNLLNPNCIKAVVDKSHFLTFGASRLVKGVQFCRDLDEILKREHFDAVYVTTSTQSHYSIVSRLLEAHVKHIFVEKPPTTDSNQLASLIDRMHSDQTVMVGLQKRFALPFRHAKDLISKKTVGDVEEISAHIRSGDITLPTSRFDSLGRGALLDLGIHLMDLLQWMFNVTVVEHSNCRKIHSGVDDCFEAELKTKDNLRVKIEVSWSEPQYRLPETLIRVRASEGELNVTEDYLKLKSRGKKSMFNDQEELVIDKPHYYSTTHQSI